MYFHSEIPWVSDKITCNNVDGLSRVWWPMVLEMCGLSSHIRLKFMSTCLRSCIIFWILRHRACIDPACSCSGTIAWEFWLVFFSEVFMLSLGRCNSRTGTSPQNEEIILLALSVCFEVLAVRCLWIFGSVSNSGCRFDFMFFLIILLLRKE